ncbi:TPA: sulfotransferase domain-containing protein [Vibrio vulnificus]|uniref:sulfotransferase family protein n=1 Tax=Vibrio vulnificus TaxID=672 RepID=UPI001A2C6F8B|nr:sulfotransferase domain-containing protein [Vibrio vulnificus]HAS6384382.1 sulfotransferase [Vibrio vulnificus]HDY7623893.1 sulfotransferase domain-containing protein [Vibrio vulnificus]HDY7702387.1 sulfotransferase domain-containing protein [Vibrio vulnificus]HDY7766210.1 sulfotransferase domain-containing protein [Vibrio vulnificus]
MRPNLFIIGGQKCGTSALAHFIAQHPEICLAKGKEAHIFDHPDFFNGDGLESLSQEVLDQAYEPKFAHANNERYLCDATPIYAYWHRILPVLAQYQPAAKVIFMLRDPVERAISQYTMERSRGLESQSMLRAFLSESKRLKQAQNNYGWDSPLRTHSYIDRGFFSEQLAQIEQLFAPENILIMHNDELRYQHHDALARVFQFLQIQNREIQSESVFSGKYTPPSLSERMARLYAMSKLYKEQQFVRQFAPKRRSKSE